MTPEGFVKEMHLLKLNLLKTYFEEESSSAVSQLIESMKLDKTNQSAIKEIIDASLTDALYTVLLGLDGAAVIGSKQELYQLKDESGNELTGGDIESNAWEYFHGEQ